MSVIRVLYNCIVMRRGGHKNADGSTEDGVLTVNNICEVQPQTKETQNKCKRYSLDADKA